jgi:DMSO/TMAO reductase YedYZ heme-binding membrane subunit
MIIFLLLACTSFDKAIRKMGFSKWKLLQRFTYIGFILSFAHFLLNLNGYFVLLRTGVVFVNIAEIILILLGIATILIQFAGFFKKRQIINNSKKQTQNQA